MEAIVNFWKIILRLLIGFELVNCEQDGARKRFLIRGSPQGGQAISYVGSFAIDLIFCHLPGQHAPPSHNQFALA
jgi:hypothetical protein